MQDGIVVDRSILAGDTPARSTRAGQQADTLAQDQVFPGEPLTKRDLIIGTIIALIMATVFARLSSGRSLIVTFIPGLAFTWLTFIWLYAKQRPLPSGPEFFPIFFATLGVQFIHFAEEFVTGFRIQFPGLYYGAPYGEDLFVTFNMMAYFIFTMACVLAFTKHLRFLLIPVLFFIIYGAVGNAISHTWWSLHLKSYFPGLVSAQIYWIMGPLVLYKLLGDRKMVFAIITLFAGVMIPLLSVFASR